MITDILLYCIIDFFLCKIVNTGCPKKKYPDLVDPSDKNIA